MISFRKNKNETWEYRIHFKIPGPSNKEKQFVKRGFKTREEACAAAFKDRPLLWEKVQSSMKER